MRNNSPLISKDKKHINLPIPLGGKFYDYHSTCNNLCYKTEKCKEKFSCSHHALCHTKLDGVTEDVLELENLFYFIKYYKDTVFLTKEEAEQRGILVTNQHINKLRELGLYISNDGNLDKEILYEEN